MATSTPQGVLQQAVDQKRSQLEMRRTADQVIEWLLVMAHRLIKAKQSERLDVAEAANMLFDAATNKALELTELIKNIERLLETGSAEFPVETGSAEFPVSSSRIHVGGGTDAYPHKTVCTEHLEPDCKACRVTYDIR